MEVICPRGTKRDTEAFAEIEGVAIHRYPLTAATGGPAGYVREYGTALWRTLRLARRLSREEPFDVVHACNPPDLLFLHRTGAAPRGARFLFDHHDLVPELFESRFEGGRAGAAPRLAYCSRRATFRACDAVISTNESYRRAAIERGGLPPDRVRVVRSAPDLSRFVPVAPDPALKRGRPFLVRYLGVMGPQDGVDYALRAVAHLRRARPRGRALHVHRRRRRVRRIGGAGAASSARATWSSSPAACPTRRPGRSCRRPTSACRRTR